MLGKKGSMYSPEMYYELEKPGSGCNELSTSHTEKSCLRTVNQKNRSIKLIYRIKILFFLFGTKIHLSVRLDSSFN